MDTSDRARVTRAAAEAVSAWRAVQSGLPAGELAYRRDVTRFERTSGRLRTRVFVSAVGGVATLVAGASGSRWWFVVTALAAWYGITGLLRLRRTVPPARPAYGADWSPAPFAVTNVTAPTGRRGRRGHGLDLMGALVGRSALSRGAVGADEAERLAVAEAHLARVVPAVERLYPPAGAELARSVAEASPLLHQQVERLVVLDGVARDMGSGAAGESATQAARQVADRLRAGVQAYEGLLAAAAELLGAPDLGRSADELLSPAVDGMKAYPHGLGTADGGTPSSPA